jgi:hypothetical protein
MNAFQHYSQPQQHHHSSNTLDNIIGSNDNITPVPLKRTRAKRSCDFCRKRKSRCDADASTPCANCKAVRILSLSIHTEICDFNMLFCLFV